MALAHGNIHVEHREVFLRDRPPSLYEISPKATVPVLYIHNNKVIDESLDIMKWALSQLESNWYMAYQKEQDQMIEHNDTVFKGWLDKYKYHDRYPEYSRNYYRNKCTETLSQYELKLTYNPYLMGKQIGIVDAAIFPFIRQCANVDREWFSITFPNLETWLAHWITSNIFQSIMPKLDAWKKGDKPLYISYGIEEK